MKRIPQVLALLFVATPAQADIIFHQDFEEGTVPTSGSDGFYSNSANHCCDYSIDNVTSPAAHEGDHAIFTTCTEDDQPVNGHTHRANLTSSFEGLVNGKEVLPYDTDRWFGFSVYISQASADEVTTTNILNTHTHNWGAPECGSTVTSSPVGLRFIGHSYRWMGPEMQDPDRDDRYQWALRSHPVYANGSDEHGYLLRMDAEADVGRWVDWVFRINLSYTPGGPGLLQVWKDGALIYESFDFDMSTNPIPQHCGHAYPKIGAGTAVIEADPGKTGLPYAVLYDSIRWGDENSSYEEVDPSQDVAATGGAGGGGAAAGGTAGGGGAGAATGGTGVVGGFGASNPGDGLDGANDGSDEGAGCRLADSPARGPSSSILFLAALGAAWAFRRRPPEGEAGGSEWGEQRRGPWFVHSR